MRLPSLKWIRPLGSLLLVLLIGVMVVGSSPAADMPRDGDAAIVGDSSGQQATNTPRPTRTPQATRTPRPSRTPPPTRTPRPSRTPTPDTRLPTFAFPLTSFGYQMRAAPDDLSLAIFNSPAFYLDAPNTETTAIQLIDTLLGDSIMTFRGATDFALDVAFTSDGESLVSYHQNGDLLVWNTASGELEREIRTYYINNDSRLHMMNDGERVIVFNRGVTVPSMIVNLETGFVEQFIGLHHDSLFDLRSNSQLFANFDTETQFTSFVVTPDEQQIYVANANGDILRWRDGDLVVWREPDDKNAYQRSFAIRRMVLTADGETLVLSDELLGEIRWLDTATGRQLGSLTGVDVPSFAVSPDGTQIVWLNRRERAAYIAPLTANAVPRLIATFDSSHQVTPNTRPAFSADGSTVMIGGFGSQTGNNAVYVVDVSGV